MWGKFLLYFHTLRHLRWIQVRYRIYYIFREKWRQVTKYHFDFQSVQIPSVYPLTLKPSITAYHSFFSPATFQFLNLKQKFKFDINWNYASYGKLWTYNLNYFEFLLQDNITEQQGLELIHDFIKKIETIKDGLEPYPISLRTIFWLRFLAKHQINDTTINQTLFGQLKILSQYREYHIMGNHLLENGFALLFGGIYFNHLPFYKKAENILRKQLEEQILNDGGHFERSPMYHQIILYRLLDCINLLDHNTNLRQIDNTASLHLYLKEKSIKMLGWLLQMTWQNGEVLLLKDSAKNIAPTTSDLIKYAKRLGLTPFESTLKDSHYRRLETAHFVAIVDIGSIGPNYINGHAHSDHLSFCMQINGQNFIIDTGISTYEKNQRRQVERSTQVHNTVQISNENQSKVWGGFRVAQRAKVTILQDDTQLICAEHNGYRHHKIIHRRTFQSIDNQLVIIDELKYNKKVIGTARFHFPATITPTLHGNQLQTALGKLTFTGNIDRININTFHYATQYNQLVTGRVVEIAFSEQLQTIIQV